MTDDIRVASNSHALWSADSTLTLCSVPWDMNYRDVVRFSNGAALNAYIDGLDTADRHVITNATYHRANEPLIVEDPFNSVSLYNYVRVSQPPQKTTPEEPQKDYYYFITGVQHLAPNATAITVQLDVFQTYIYDVRFGRSYVERGHVGIAESAAFNDHGVRRLTVPEGLDTGNTFRQVSATDVPVMNTGSSHYVIYSTISLATGHIGDADSPRVRVPPVSRVFGVQEAVGVYLARDLTFMEKLNEYPWVAQGIFKIIAIPDISRYYSSFNWTTVNEELGLYRPPTGAPPQKNLELFYGFRNSTNLANYIGDRYKNLRKFYTSPYMWIEIATHTGSTLSLRPELIPGDDLNIVETSNFTLSNGEIRFSPRYNNDNQYDLFAGISELPTFATVNNNAAISLASTKNSREFAASAAEWSQTKAGMAIDTASQLAEVQRAGMSSSNDIASWNAREQNRMNSQWRSEDAVMGGWTSVGKGAVGGGAVGGVAGAVTGAGAGLANGVLGYAQANIANARAGESLAQQLTVGNLTTDLAMSQNQQSNDINSAYARSAARGDYQQAIASIEASKRDTMMMPPSQGAQAGGQMLLYLRGQLGFTAKVKMIPQDRIRAIGELWLKYGYMIGSYMNIPSDLKCMEKFTYWKMTDTYLVTGRMPETFKNTIRGMFEKGTTVWNRPQDIGQTDPADNEPILKRYY